ncbi:MAG TPA: DNRLRE domain-containing protein [Actinophytocola sp.]|uniref:DNRLRE domain-containing protein n=1 Tax=Actinophytocola sp. TaxID=1872138 RepID=UPI002DB6CF69|nr:DNRLRE domain-containing protein [Actinophytocola sp.]HEU5476180.1 DNRLRE domain-containing protein [Actinophytocola sp.]
MYPVVVDPWLTALRMGWTHIDSGFPEERYFDDQNRPDVPVGAYVHTNGNIHLSISYFNFGTLDLRGMEIIAATFKAVQIHNAPFACVSTPVQLVMTGWVSQSTSWRNPPPFERAVAATSAAFKEGHAGCPANWVEFDAKSAVEIVAAERREGVTLAMQAPNWDTVNRKRFGKTATLVVEYNSPPSAPSGLTADINLPCASGTDLPATNTSPTLFATGFDADGASVEMRFEWGVAGSGQIIGSYVHPFAPSGRRFSAVVPTSDLRDGVTYSWHAVAGDGRVWGASSGWCGFVFDTTRPTAVPTVTSTSFPENDIGARVGVRGEFTFSSTDPDVYGYRYGFTESTTSFVAAASRSGPAGGGAGGSLADRRAVAVGLQRGQGRQPQPATADVPVHRGAEHRPGAAGAG